MKSLAEMKPGEEAAVLEVKGDTALRVRLMEMGLLRGERVKVLKYAPFGDPIELLVGDYHLSLRKRDASHVLVQPASDGTSGQAS